ncbi:hypothetical protein MKW98_019837 [Papaver atlanticum]|uniref:Uncharacterized protein n=1 Tax=Papaver atlanticum TaxID=357466 RepID=A0AAD4X751_9MAGN|nr:hypothetical protein MKW98_019837 [Papaver atlanticum]
MPVLLDVHLSDELLRGDIGENRSQKDSHPFNIIVGEEGKINYCILSVQAYIVSGDEGYLFLFQEAYGLRYIMSGVD